LSADLDRLLLLPLLRLPLLLRLRDFLACDLDLLLSLDLRGDALRLTDLLRLLLFVLLLFDLLLLRERRLLDRLRDRERDLDLDLDRLPLRLLLFFGSSSILILFPPNSVSSSLSMAVFISEYVANSTTPSPLYGR